MSILCRAETVEEQSRRIQDMMTAEGMISLKEWREELEKLQHDPSDREIMAVAGKLGGLKEASRFNELRPEADRLYEEAQQTLLAIPGHAEAYGRSFWKVRDEVSEGRTTYGDLVNARAGVMSAFPHLRSPEMMRVLGEILGDTKGEKEDDRFPGQPLEFHGPPCSADWAVMTLHKVGIANPPVIEDEQFRHQMMYRFPELRAEWQRWWDEVKAGKRTYRFTGSDIEYGYEGPVEAKAPRPLRRLERGETGGLEQEPPSGGGRNGVWFAVVVVVAGGGATGY